MLKPLLSRATRRPVSAVVVAFVFSTLFLGLLVSPIRQSGSSFLRQPWATDTGATHPIDDGKSRGPWHSDGNAVTRDDIHILLPATKSNVQFCKMLLTMTILGYPNPTIVAWGDSTDGGGLLGGGSHFAKITRVLEYINDEERRKKPGFDNELVFMLDTYDIWFQLPVETLLERYHGIVKEENARVAHRMGRAFDAERIHSPIIFGGGKRCSPNEIHTLSCYPVPETPLPDDLYRGNTDTLMGRNMHSSFRTRYLNSGYMIGPVGEMRPLLERAKTKLEECIHRTKAEFDNGTGGSDLCYHGSDQSIFVEMFGEQEFQREVMRRRHHSMYDEVMDKIVSNRAGAWPPPTHTQNAPILDRLNPGYTHQKGDPTYLPGRPHEFGIGIDYWSLLGHQSSNAEHDYRYIKHNEPLEPQVGYQGIFDCPAKAPMPNDLPGGTLPFAGDAPNRWETMPLFTEICVGTVPVMIHHNSIEKNARERYWSSTWWHGRSRALLEQRRQQGAPQLNEGIPSDKGTVLSWEELCPVDVEPELFRDVEAKKEEEAT